MFSWSVNKMKYLRKISQMNYNGTWTYDYYGAGETIYDLLFVLRHDRALCFHVQIVNWLP
jgi:hypothetical protein